VDEDIINYTGATLSSKAVARGVKRALFLLDTFIPGKLATNWILQANSRSNSMSPVLTTDSQGIGLVPPKPYAMGSICEVRLWCHQPTRRTAPSPLDLPRFVEIERVFSAYRDDSELASVNRNAGSRPVQVSEEFFDLADMRFDPGGSMAFLSM